VASPGAGVIVVMGLGGDLPAIEVVGYWEGTLLGGRDSAASPRIGVITVLGLESDLSATDFFLKMREERRYSVQLKSLKCTP